jgi:hypothetical protein
LLLTIIMVFIDWEWKCIRRGWDGFTHHVDYEVGNGFEVLFWHDVWCGDLPLKNEDYVSRVVQYGL